MATEGKPKRLKLIVHTFDSTKFHTTVTHIIQIIFQAERGITGKFDSVNKSESAHTESTARLQK